MIIVKAIYRVSMIVVLLGY